MTRNEIASLGTLVAFFLLLVSIPFWPRGGLPASDATSDAKRPETPASRADRLEDWDQLDEEISALRAELDAAEVEDSVAAQLVEAAGKTCAGAVSLPDQVLTREGEAEVYGIVRNGLLVAVTPDTPGSARLVGEGSAFVSMEWTPSGCRVVDQGPLQP